MNPEITEYFARPAATERTPATTPSRGDNWLVARVIGANADGLCMVTGLTRQGARVMSGVALAVEEAVTLDFGEGMVPRGQVRWTEAGVTGIEFDAPASATLLEQVGQDQEPIRHGPRFRRCATVVLERHGRELEAELVNISSEGACISALPVPWVRIGATINVEIEGFDPIEAVVRWIANDRVGVSFETRVQLWGLDKWLKLQARHCETCLDRNCTPARTPR